ncbi:alpha/beta hydrolase [Jatrophihabitans sp.]|uniref:alpha/beta fold hydrolase n=1 Tax=Jatrophihabitans sp. TaxID=1932789 RepID=UPI0030C76063|nr:alpha/beta hydrolase fold protein [Jatrophihabitans sp.]
MAHDVAGDEVSSFSIPARGLSFEALAWGPGDGRTVLLLHGFPQRNTSWTEIGRRLGEAGLHAVAVNQRGYSPGARPTEVAAYALPELVADTVAVISALGGSVDLVGHDFGGVVGWQVATRHPELVRTFTAVSTPNPLALNDVLARSAEQRARFGYILRFREPGVAEAALLADDAAYFRSLFGGVVPQPQVDDDAAFFAEPGVLTAALNWYRAMSPHDADGLTHTAVPSTLIWGSEDPAFGREAAENTRYYVDAPYSFVPLEGAGHWLLEEAVDTVAESIAERVLP